MNLARFGLSVSLLCGCPALAQVDASQQPVTVDAARKGVAFVVDHFGINRPAVGAGGKNQPSLEGHWGVSRSRPPECSTLPGDCLRVTYTVDTPAIAAEWVVSMPKGSDPAILSENAAARANFFYEASPAEVDPLITARQDAVYPPIAMAAHVYGPVLLTVAVSEQGRVSVLVRDGPAMLRSSAMDAAKRWKYAPLLIGGAPVSYAVMLEFDYSSQWAGRPGSGVNVSGEIRPF